MFDCKQDIRLLHGSLSSAAYSKSDNLFDCAKVKDTLPIIYNSIKTILHHFVKTSKDEKEKINIQLHCNQRLHTAIFFTTLRSHGIKSQAADEFYDSILYNWPKMSLKFYVELNFKCDWSEYFLMCALQLPSETLLYVLKMIFEISFESDIQHYSWHLILQTLIYKLFKVSYDEKAQYPFDFDFIFETALSFNEKSLDELTEKNSKMAKEYDSINKECHKIIKNDNTKKLECDYDNHNDSISENNIVSDNDYVVVMKENDNSAQIPVKITEHDDEDTEEEDQYLTPFNYEISDNEDETTIIESEDLTLFKELCCIMFDNIACKLEESSEIGILKILLHAAKVISKFFKNGLIKDDSVNFPCENFVKLLKNYLLTDISQANLKSELKECPVIFTRHAYTMVSWNVCLNYLIFLLKYYIEEVFPSDVCSSSLSECDLLHTNLVSVIDSLYCLNYPFLKSEEHIVLLCKIIKLEFQGSSYCAKLILSDASVMEKKNVMTILEENCHVINLSDSYFLIVDHIMATDSPELKKSLLRILYTCLQRSSLDMYNTVIGYIMTNYGLTDKFQLPGCNDLLSDFTYQTPNQEEIEKKIPALLIQNPKSTLKYLLDETLLQGQEGRIFIQLLRYFKDACFYMKKSGPICILHEILNDYFTKPKLEALFLKNMVTLYRFLAEVHLETPILLPCAFFNECIIPLLYPECNKIHLVLECAYVLIPLLLTDENFLKDSELFLNLITKFGILANYFIVRGNGEMKSLILPIVKDLIIHQQKYKLINEKQKLVLWSTFKNFDEMTCVYFKECLPEDIKFISKVAVWIQCCNSENLSNFEEIFSVKTLTYTSLVNTLTEVLPHLTKKEWAFSFNLVKMCCTNNEVQEEITCSNNPFQLHGSELSTYAAILSVITSVHFILNDNIDGSLYVSSCLSNLIKDVICKEGFVYPHLLLSVALEVCHLISSISPDIIHVYLATLLEMKKELCSCSSDENDYIRLFNHAINRLPNLCQDESK